MTAALSPVEIWREMRLHLQWSEGLVLVVLFADSSAALAPLRQWVGDAGRDSSWPLKRLTPANAAEAVVDVLGGLEAQVQAMPDLRAPVWVELLAHTTPTQAWDAARAECLARLNEARAWLSNTFKRPLVLCLPTTWLAQIGPVAPDLWHIRSYAATVLSQAALTPMGSIFPAVDVAPNWAGLAKVELALGELENSPAVESADLLVTLRRRVVEAAQRDVEQRPSPGALRQLWQAKDGFSHSLLQAGNFVSAQQVATEALSLMRQLRQSLGDRPPVLRDLVMALNTVGDAERHAGRIDHALAAYREGLELCRQWLDSSGDNPQVQDLLRTTWVKKGEAEREAGQFDAALLSYQRALELQRQRRHSFGDAPQILRDLVALLIALGDLEHDRGHDQAGLVAYSESLELQRQLRQRLDDGPQALDELAVSLERLACSPALPWPQRQAVAAEALRLRQQLGAAFPESDYHRVRLSVTQEIATPLLSGEPG